MANKLSKNTNLPINASLAIYSIPKNNATIVSIITILPKINDKLSKQKIIWDVTISIVKNHLPKSIKKKDPEMILIHNRKRLLIKNKKKQNIDE